MSDCKIRARRNIERITNTVFPDVNLWESRNIMGRYNAFGFCIDTSDDTYIIYQDLPTSLWHLHWLDFDHNIIIKLSRPKLTTLLKELKLRLLITA